MDVLINLKTKIDSNTIPPRLSAWPDNWQCQYCQFREICAMAGPGDVSWEEFKLKIKSQNKIQSPTKIVSN